MRVLEKTEQHRAAPRQALGSENCTVRGWSGIISQRPYACLAVAIVLATAIRLYLVSQYYCISSDGVRYIEAARDFYAGRITAGLSSTYPPLYPIMIAAVYPLIGDWERAGQIWSLLGGVLVLVPLFALLRRIYGTNVAVLASFLAAMAPFLARYSAHVRTEIPFIFLSTVALLLFHSGIRSRLWRDFFYGGLIVGLAYLLRPEAVGFLVVVPLALAIEWRIRKTSDIRAVYIGCFLTLLGFLIIAVPYGAHLATETGDWGTISRKTNLTIWYGFKDRGILDDDQLAALLAPGAPGIVEFFLIHPFAYIKKIVLDIPASLGVYLEAIHYSYVPFLILGIYHAIRRRIWEQADLLLFIFVIFFIVGFAALYVNLRYAVQVIPASLGWVAMGLIWSMNYDHFRRLLSPRAFNVTALVIGLAFVGGTLGKALRPIALEKAHVRESGAYLKGLKDSDGLNVMVFDERIAFYAEAQRISLTGVDEPTVVQTLREGRVDYIATEIEPWQAHFPAIAKDPLRFGLVLDKEFRASGKGRILIFKARQT
jgi:4-amino-4-deoxy-L-arabinose transferase-like glycosyltransferase